MIPWAVYVVVVNTISPVSFWLYILSHPGEGSVIKSEYFSWHKVWEYIHYSIIKYCYLFIDIFYCEIIDPSWIG